ncbi:MAG: Gfo/Idh/MocA family oxidoreductase [Bryobacterales bacterium]|nr:Gfo/Idh/MocA family oxidoreductase [Bryobacterales bacterium]
MSVRGFRVGLVGCGEVCEHKHLPALCRVAGARVVAVADPNADRARHVAGRYGIAHVYGDVTSLIEARVADVIGVLTPPSAHRESAVQAMQAGLPVLVEKPLALTIEDADELVETARATGAIALMGFHMRFHRLVRRAAQVVESGELGKLESIHTIWCSPRPDEGIPHWKRRRRDGGGSIVELGVHMFDMWRYLLRAEVDEVYAVARHGTRDDESAVISARLSNGVLASAQLSERTAHQIEIEICGDRGRVRVYGQRFDGLEVYARAETNGGLGARFRSLARFAREFPQGLMGMRRLGDYGDSYQAMWAHLLESIGTGKAPACTLEDGRRAVQVALAAAASADSGRAMKVEDAAVLARRNGDLSGGE